MKQERTVALLLLLLQCCLGEEDAESSSPDTGVRTLQQVLMVGEDDEVEEEVVEEDGVFEVSVGARHLEQEQRNKADVAARILSGSDAKGSVYSKVTSASPARLALSPAAKLHGAPGETVQIEYFLTNLSPRNYFTALARESSAPALTDPEAVNFPQQSSQSNFLVGLSELRPNVGQNETRPIVLTMKVPPSANIGTRRLLTLEVQPYGNNVAGSTNTMARRLYFTVGTVEPRTLDSEAPACRTVSDNFEEQCGQQQTEAACGQRRWNANFDISDIGSGLRSITERPATPYNDLNHFFSHDNFVIGDRGTAAFLYAASCCLSEGVTLTVFDVAGNEGTCRAGGRSSSELPPVQAAAGFSSTTTVIVVVVVVLLLLLLVAAGVAIVLVKRKRKADLAEMRESPQAR